MTETEVAASTPPPEASRRPPRRKASVVAGLVGVAGELLITAGVLLGLFVVWQLWWTDVVAEREQEELLEGLDWAVFLPDFPEYEPEPAVDPRRYDPAPTMAEPADRTTFATLRVPRWGDDYLRTISQGTAKRAVLDTLGIGHYEGTAMPGGIGNFAVAGHRATYGKPFNRILEIMAGDALVVQTPENWYVYRATSSEVVRPSRIDVIAPVPGDPDGVPTKAMMTLTTCHPMYSARERFILYAELDYWMPVADGTPVELTDPAAGLGGGA